MVRFSTTLLLSATCLLINAVTVTTCDGNKVHRLSCDTGVISVQAALYGRADNGTCSEQTSPQQTSNNNTNCSLTSAVDALKRRCDGKKVCEQGAHFLQAFDTCGDTFECLQTTYTCIPAIHRVTCEHSFTRLQCDDGQVISILGADYGRHDQTTCIYKRPVSQIQYTECSGPSTKVSDSCNGKNSCVIQASNSVFGDPCIGTYKYLEVAYMCEYPVTIQEDSS